MKSSDKYQPISCVFYDYIEHYALKKEIVELSFKDGNEKKILHTRLLDTKSKNKVEYVQIEGKEWIRMDRIISINEHILADYNQC